MAKITLIGMHNYTNGDIWPSSIPAGISRDTFINTVMLNYGECETLYADPDFMKFAISNWFSVNQWGIEKAIKAINIEYDPLYNYDRHESTTESTSKTEKINETNKRSGGESNVQSGGESNVKSGKENNVKSGGHSNTKSGNETTSATSSSDSSATSSKTTTTNETTEEKVSAFDSGEYQPKNQTTTSGTVEETGSGSSKIETTTGNTHTYNDIKDTFDYLNETDTTTYDNVTDTKTYNNVTDTLTYNDVTDKKDGDNSESAERNMTTRAYGNIGVTTSQQMLQAELELAKYNIYKTFASIFASDLLILVY